MDEERLEKIKRVVIALIIIALLAGMSAVLYRCRSEQNARAKRIQSLAAEASAYEAELKTALDGVSELIMDFEQLEYISSAGLRVLLTAQKLMNKKQGAMKVIHSNSLIQEVFEVTGFADIITIE